MIFTAEERALLRRHAVPVGALICSGQYEIYRWKEGSREGGGHGFHHRYTRTAIEGTRHEWIVTDRFPDGRPWRWTEGALIWSARVTYTRLLRWRETLPFPIRHAAVVWYRTNPVETRDLRRLEQLVLRVLADPTPPPAPPEPLTELALFDLEETSR